ncbi:DUF2917 domain-containing protein [Pseudothauera nasutitermitis]|uniref:DUF2917 domain-containing protein n=1 Tax=Pseudothauera nasutitermitis TaxID=2565930 RepID=A0A4V3WAW1_9RHOO|nr:DUF2917 domain-containing protein [Pseudothauera nasutitermitis]THF60766.1 DUF2917 domain-containing protein [Pseudothauera nasutitermitis]
MDARFGIATHRLAPRAVHMLTGAAGTEVICRSGCTWITQYGDSRDVVLHAGQSFVLECSSVVVMSSNLGAEILLRAAMAPRPHGWLRRLAGWLDPRSGSTVARDLAGRLPGSAGARPL